MEMQRAKGGVRGNVVVAYIKGCECELRGHKVMAYGVGMAIRVVLGYSRQDACRWLAWRARVRAVGRL